MMRHFKMQMNWKLYAAFNILNVTDCIIVSEGANTMDIGRTVLLNRLPKHRLDAGINI